MFGLEGGELGAEGGESGDGVLVCGGEGGEFGLERVCFAVVGVHSRVHCAVKLGGRRHCVHLVWGRGVSKKRADWAVVVVMWGVGCTGW